ncbi:MAG: hypothetical protein IPG99_15785 [Ignavibacteria bacterium]|nr:hypothetical protein [Ignavibacteria bacterium]
MNGFHTNWLGGMNKSEAFTKAQNEMRKNNNAAADWAALF